MDVATGALVASIVRDVVVTVGAVIGTFVGVRGLDAWRRQMQGKDRYEVAKRVLQAVYAIRNAIRYVRSPFIWEGEDRAATEAAGGETKEEAVGRAIDNARWKTVLAPLTDLEGTVLECEAIWGSTFVDDFGRLRGLIHELGLSRHYYWKAMSEGHRDYANTEHAKSAAAIAIARGDPQHPDEFEERVNVVIQKIEQKLRPEMKVAR